MKHSLPWESVPPPIYPAQASLKPRKKWVQTGGWILVVVLLLFGISTRSRNPLLAFVSLAFSVAVSADADDQKGRRSHEPRT